MSVKSDPAAAAATPIYPDSDVHHSQPHPHHHSHHYSGYSHHGLDYGLHNAEAEDSGGGGGGGRLTIVEGYDAAAGSAAVASNPAAFPPSPSSETSASTGIEHCSVFDVKRFSIRAEVSKSLQNFFILCQIA